VGHGLVVPQIARYVAEAVAAGENRIPAGSGQQTVKHGGNLGRVTLPLEESNLPARPPIFTSPTLFCVTDKLTEALQLDMSVSSAYPVSPPIYRSLS
jgi:hypothetical protein